MKSIVILSVLLLSFGSLKAQNTTKTNQEIENLLAKKRAYNIASGFGYTIQIYNGDETIALKKQAQFQVLFPSVLCKLVYNEPEWKTQVGNFKTKLEADRTMLAYKKEFSGVIVVPVGK